MVTKFSDKSDISDKRIDSFDVQKNPPVPHGRVFYLPAIPESLITNITHVTKYIKSLKKKSDIKSDIKRDSNVTFVT